MSTGKPNVVYYSDLIGVSLDVGDYQPTADAPLIVKVPEGTQKLGSLDVRGWDPSGGAQQAFARYILLDLSEVTNEVLIDGLTMGAVWSPSADLVYNSNITTNGQWLSRDFTAGPGAGELHHHAFSASIPCPMTEVDPEPSTTPDPSVTPDPSTTPDPSVTPDPSTTPTPAPSTTPGDGASATPTASGEPTATTTPSRPSVTQPGLPATGGEGVESTIGLVVAVGAIAVLAVLAVSVLRGDA